MTAGGERRARLYQWLNKEDRAILHLIDDTQTDV